MPIIRAAKKIAVTVERFFVYRVLSLDDTPHRIALGVAIGIFITWTPTIGVQMALIVAISALFRANKFVGVPFAWISTPFTAVPIYYPSYRLGCWLLRKEADPVSTISDAAQLTGGWLDRTWEWAQAIMSIFWELWLGSLIVALVLGFITYFVIYFLVVNYRKGLHAWQEHHHHHEKPKDDDEGENASEEKAKDTPNEIENKPETKDEQPEKQSDEQQSETPQEPEKVS